MVTSSSQAPATAAAAPVGRGAGARDAMLRAATKLFRVRGYQGVGVADLLEASGLPRGSLYFHFPGGKEQIALEAMARAQGSVAANVAEVAAVSADLPAFITGVCAAWAEALAEADYARGCGVGVIALEMAAVSPALRAGAEATFIAWERQLAEIFGRFGLAPAAAAQSAAALLAGVQGAIILAKARRDRAAFAAVADAVIALSGHRP